MRGRPRHGVRIDVAVGPAVHGTNGQAVLARELEIALVVRGHAHDGARAVLGQDEIGEPDRDALAGPRVEGPHARVEPFLLARLRLPFEAGFPADALDKSGGVGVRAGPERDLLRGRMLGRERQKRRAEEGVGPRREHGDRRVEALDPKLDLGAARSSDPVALHRLDAVGPVRQLVETREQAVGVMRDAQEPLRQIAQLDGVARTLAAPVHDLLVGEHGAASRAPIDGRLLAVREAALPHAQEEPLVPAVVVRVAGSELLGPVVEQAERSELLLHPRDVGQRVLARRRAARDRGVFRRQAERVPAHRVQDAAPLHPLESVERVAQDVVSPVPDVQTAARRVREHVEHVELVARLGRVDEGRAVLLPAALPLRVDRGVVVSLGHGRGILHGARSANGEARVSRRRAPTAAREDAPRPPRPERTRDRPTDPRRRASRSAA